MIPRPRLARSRPRAGFVLPAVIGLGMVLTFLAVAMLERVSAQTLLQRRQQQVYLDHHAEKGMQEAIGAWMTANSSGDLENSLREDGLAFTLTIARGQRVEVGFEEAQGQLLADFTGLSQDMLLDVAAAVDELEGLVPREIAETLIRREGPYSVSLRTAPRPVLEAVLRAILPTDKVQQTLSRLLTVQGEIQAIPRGEQSPSFQPTAAGGAAAGAGSASARATPQVDEARRLFDEALTQTGIEPREKDRLQRLITTQPTLYRVFAVAHPPARAGQPQSPPVRYEGTALIRTPRAPGGQSVQRNNAFLTWRRLEAGEAPTR